jgi:antitoxin PrlF
MSYGAATILDRFDIPYYNVRSRGIRASMAVATLTSKGQITIPSRVRAALGLEAGDRVEFVEQEKGQFAIVAATRSVQELKGLFRGKRSKPVSIEEMNAAIARRASGSR